jgi:hypothetical protein
MLIGASDFPLHIGKTAQFSSEANLELKAAWLSIGVMLFGRSHHPVIVRTQLEPATASMRGSCAALHSRAVKWEC